MSDVAPPAAPPAPDLVGTVLAGRYRILQKLGEGAMGAVYLGEHLRIGRRDAIKVLRETLAGDAEALARFGRGARNVSLIQHPNVCTVYDFGDTPEGRCFLAMEYVPGESLQDTLAREGRLPPARAVAIFAQVAGALQAAHDARIVHRDLKPANVMVSPGRDGADVVKVVDFDIAKGSRDGEPGEVTRLGFVIGTPEYMSPEQLLGMALDGRSDVYSLALVLFRMLTGALPFRAADTQELMVQRLTGTALRLDEVAPGLAVPPGLQPALDRALQRRAEDRFESAAAFAAAVADAFAQPASASHAGPSAPPPERTDTRGGIPPTVIAVPGPIHPPPEPVRPHRRITLPHLTPARVSGGLLAVALTAGAVWGVSRVMGPSPEAGLASDSTVVQPDTGAGAVTPDSQQVVIVTDSIHTTTTDSTQGGIIDPPVTNETETQGQQNGTTGTEKGRPGGNETDSNDNTRPPVDPPVEKERRPRAGPYGLTAENVGERMLDLIGRMSASSAPGTLREVRDQAMAAYRLDGASARDRALAARVAADALGQLGDPDGCVQWAERSLRLRDAASTRTLLDACRGAQP